MPKLIAVTEFSYATRMLRPGQAFEATPKDARLLIAVKRAREMREPAKIEAPPVRVAEKIQKAAAAAPPPADPLDHDGDGTPGGSMPAAERGDDIEKLRAEAGALGVTVDRRWGAKRLQAEIDKARV